MAELDNEELRILSKVYRASTSDENLPQLRSDLRQVNFMSLRIRVQKSKDYRARFLLHALVVALMESRRLEAFHIRLIFEKSIEDENARLTETDEQDVEWLLRPCHLLPNLSYGVRILPVRVTSHSHLTSAGKLSSIVFFVQHPRDPDRILRRIGGKWSGKFREAFLASLRGWSHVPEYLATPPWMMDNFLQYMEDLPRLFPGKSGPDCPDYDEQIAKLLERALEACDDWEMDAFDQVLADTKARHSALFLDGARRLDALGEESRRK